MKLYHVRKAISDTYSVNSHQISEPEILFRDLTQSAQPRYCCFGVNEKRQKISVDIFSCIVTDVKSSFLSLIHDLHDGTRIGVSLVKESYMLELSRITAGVTGWFKRKG